MAKAMKHLRVDGSKIGAVMQTMVDYKLDYSKVDLDGVMGPAAELRLDYQHHGFGKGDKLATGIDLPRGGAVRVKDKLPLELTGGALGKFHRYLDIPLNGRLTRTKIVKTLHDGLQLISRMDPGGNAPNETRNLVHLMEAEIGPDELYLFSSTDPLFEDWYKAVSEQAHERIYRTMLQKADAGSLENLPPRKAVHIQYSERADISIANPATSTISYIRKNLRELLQFDHVIVSEGLGRAILGTRLKKRQDLLQKVNPSSAFRGDCAVDSYEYTNQGGATPIVTMNDEEFDYYLRCIKGRIEGEEPEKLDPIPFLSPFSQDGKLEQKLADITNEGFREYFRFIRPSRSANLHFPLNVSSGGKGGYHVAEKEGSLFVVFSTTPTVRGAKKLLDIAGNPEGLSTKTRKTMGAGDAVSTILSLANIWDTEEFIAQYASEMGKSLIQDDHRMAAAMLFVSILSRYVGELLYRTEKCDLAQVPKGKLRDVICYAADQALTGSNDLWNISQRAKMAKVDGGMKIALWELKD